ncbi:hypothetical protein GCM10023320_27220 [Pseudonocardia adelaidensis]|uniref:Uncharacterized protein n=1 Tax=Pseudonocardia adelaidensis TaxID=648754 RepID=A0ABP9NHW7_9PSEU
MQERDEGSGTEDVAVGDQTRDLSKRYPTQLADFFGIGRLPNFLEGPPQVDVHRGIHHPRQRLEVREVLRFSDRGPAAFLHCFARSCFRGLLVLFDESTEQFVAPFVGCKAVPMHHQYLVVVVDQRGNRYRLHMDDVVLEPTSVGSLDIDERQPNPLIVVDGSLTESFSSVRIRLCGVGHERRV